MFWRVFSAFLLTFIAVLTTFACGTLIETKCEGVKSRRSGVHKPGKFDANKCSDAGASYLDVLATHETKDKKYRRPCLIDYPQGISQESAFQKFQFYLMTRCCLHNAITPTT